MRERKPARQERILAALGRAPSLRVAGLAQELGVSTETIRRDLDEMTGAGLLNRTYGGAVRPLDTEPAVTERHRLFVAERQRIARAALGVIGGARVLILGGGSTTVHVAHMVAAKLRDLMVITHSFGVASALSVNPTIKIMILPGEYHAGEGMSVGGQTVAFLQTLYADFAVLGASGLSEEGVNDALPESAAVYNAMAARAAETLVVADHSKFNRMFAAQYAGWRQIGHLATDEMPEGALAARLEAARVKIILG